MENETFVYWGGPVKALGDGKIVGPLVLFTDPESPNAKSGGWDATMEFFTAKTNFFLDPAGGTLPVLYDHGLDGTLKRRQLGRAKYEIKDVGIWAEVQLEMRDDYEKKIYAMAEMGKLGFSSGPAQHLIDKKAVKLKSGITVHELTEWAIAEASLTPMPCEFRCSATPMKSRPKDCLLTSKSDARTRSTLS